MARILLGVTGGIAAYKALELVRLATGAGHAVRVVQTPASRDFVGAASFAALTGAPVLTDEFERDPARGAFPDQAPPDHDPLSHLELVANADVLVVAPASRQHDRQARGRARRQPADQRRARRDLPGARRARDERPRCGRTPATRANVATLRERGVDVHGARRRPRSARSASTAPGGCPSPPTLLAAAEALLPAAAPASWTACGCSSPPAARASRSTRCASSATARRAGWASRSPQRGRGARRRGRSWSPRTSRCRARRGRPLRRRRRRRRELQAAVRGRVRLLPTSC